MSKAVVRNFLVLGFICVLAVFVIPMFFADSRLDSSGSEVYSFDIGVVALDTKINTSVPIRNQTERDWRIVDVVTDCGCTVAPQFPESIPAGALVEVPVVVNANVVAERFLVNVRVLIHDGGSELNFVANFHGSVVRRAPDYVDFGVIDWAQPLASIQFFLADIGLTISDFDAIRFDKQRFDVSLRRDNNRRGFIVDIIYKDTSSVGSFSGEVVFADKAGDPRPVVVKLGGVRKDVFELKPSSINFGIVSDKKSSMQVHLKPLADGFKLMEVRSLGEIGYLSCSYSLVDEGDFEAGYNLVFDLDLGKLSEGEVVRRNILVEFLLDEKKYAREIPFLALRGG